MANLSWLIRRLKAMSIPEVMWRLSQKNIQNKEEKKFGKERIIISSDIFNSKYSSLNPKAERMHLNVENTDYCLNTNIHLLSGADYKDFKNRWNAGFQTDQNWPDIFSYKLDYKQKDDIGDARTNWELNRHFQFALLAKDFAASGDEKYLCEFEHLFNDWNKENPFLHGISWTSVMEVAIRCSNWCYTYAFLESKKTDDSLLEEIRVGIINMTDYIVRHYSRYSSANNHLIVEAFAIGQSGILFNYQEWIDLSIKLLTRELPLQNYSDGVNKELSLHYQTFYMEAMGLMMRLMLKNNIDVPDSWKTMLTKMSRYVADCRGDYGEVIVFGDDDEGKILDLQGEEINHYQYVLGLMSIMLDEQFVDLSEDLTETLYWLFTKEEIEEAKKKEKYISPQYCCYKEGGNTILRSKDRKVLIGIDHAALGFGSIAAHGHADALSFQLYYEGHPIFVDPGTYIYHCDLDSRNEFRKTKNHNTVSIDEKDQSEMLGAFLWGKKAKTTLDSFEIDGEIVKIAIEHDGYKPIICRREFLFDGNRQLEIKDIISDEVDSSLNFIISPDLNTQIVHDEILLNNKDRDVVSINCLNGQIAINQHEYSKQYGLKEYSPGLLVNFKKNCFTRIELK